MPPLNSSDPMDWQFNSNGPRFRASRSNYPYPAVRHTTAADFHPALDRAFTAPRQPDRTEPRSGPHMNRMPNFETDISRPPINYTIFDEELRHPPVPSGPIAARLSSRPANSPPRSRPGRTRFLNRQAQPKRVVSPLRSMHTAETLQEPERQPSLLELARRCIEENRGRTRYIGGNPEVNRRVATLRNYLLELPDRPPRPTRFHLASRFASLRPTPNISYNLPPPVQDFQPAPLPVSPTHSYFRSSRNSRVDSQGHVRPVRSLPVRVYGRSSPRSPRPRQPTTASPTLYTPPPVLRKRVLEEYQSEAADAEDTKVQEEQLSPEEKEENELLELIRAISLEEKDVEMEDMFVPGAWPVSPEPSSSSPTNEADNASPLERVERGLQQLGQAVTSVTNQFRNAHTLIMRLGTNTGSIRRRGQQSVRHVKHVVRGAIEMAGSVKRRAVELCSSRAPVSPEKINLAKDRKNLRVLTPEEKIRIKARRLGIGRGHLYPPTLSPPPSPPPSPSQASTTEEEPPSPSVPVTHYPGAGQPGRKIKTNRPPERSRSSPVYNTDDLSPSRARKQRSPSNSPPSAQKLQASQAFINDTAIPIRSSAVQQDIASQSPSKADTTLLPPTSADSFDVFDPWSQQHYADHVPVPEPQPVTEPEIEARTEQCTEEVPFSAPGQQLAAVLGAPESVSSEDDPSFDGLFTGTERAARKAKKGAVRWADDVTFNRPIEEVRVYRPDSRIDSPLHPRERLVRGAGVKGEADRPPAPPRRVFVKALPPKWEKKVDEAMRLPNSHQLGTTPGGDPLTRRDLATCYQPLAWLNDEVINAYLAVIINFLRQTGEASSNEQPRHHAFNSFFFSNLRDKGYDSVRRWATRAKIGKGNLLGVETVLVPIHHRSHWTLLVVKPVARTIEHFDSLGGMSRAHVALIKDWLRMELGDLFVEEEWTALPSRSSQQDNGSDCGVFLLTTAKLSALNLDPLSYGAKDIPLIRKRIVGELMNGGFGGDLDPVEGRARL